MKKETIYNDILTKHLRKENIKKSNKHKRSGKISPSKLTICTLDACLQMLEVPKDKTGGQSLRNFLRGNTLEKIFVEAVFKRKQLQTKIEYKNGVGYADAFDTIPHEVKSIGWHGWKEINKENKPKYGHCIQATWYCLGTNTDAGWIHYINPETLQVVSYQINPKYYKKEVDRRINAIKKAFIDCRLPDFEPLEDWHEKATYSDYKTFFNKKGAQAEIILKAMYPDKYKIFKSGKLRKEIVGK